MFYERKSLLAEIGSRISGGRNIKDFKMLYSANKTVDVNDFHEKCDSKGPTVTLLYGRYNTMFGGYTTQDWLSTDKQVRKTDADAFLFYRKSSHGAKCCFMPIKKGKEKKAITCYSQFGPTFGGCSKDIFDLQVFKHALKDQTKSNDKYMVLNGMLKIGKSYEVSNPKETKNEINSGKLEVTCVEVYQVSDCELKDKWREEPKDFEKMKQELIAMEPHLNLGVKQYNILLVGAVGSGKSSFYNTLSTVFSEDLTPHAVVGTARKSFTNKKKEYDLVSKDGRALKIRITDIRGIDYKRGLEHEIQHILDGRLPDDFQFSEKQGPLEKDQLKDATLNEETHLVCFVTGANFVHLICSNTGEQFEYVQNKIAEKGLPLAVVVTQMDRLCQHVAEDVDHIFKCAKARDSTEWASEFFGIPPNQVFPVVNYTREEETKNGIDRLALHALYKMYHLVHAHLEKHEAMTAQKTVEEKIIYSRNVEHFGEINNGEIVENKEDRLNQLREGPKIPVSELMKLDDSDLGGTKANESVICNNEGTHTARGGSRNDADDIGDRHETEIFEKTESNKDKALGSEVRRGVGQEFSKPYNNSFTQFEVNEIAECMKSVGALMFNDEIIGTVFRAGEECVITAFHVIRGIIDPGRSGHFNFDLLESTTVRVTFRASVCETPRIRYKVRHRLSSNDPRLDYAVLQVTERTVLLPKKLKLDKYRFERLQVKLLSGVGYGNPLNSVSKTLDPNCPVILSIDQKIADCQNWLTEYLASNSQNAVNIGFDNIDKNQNIFVDISMMHRGSGSPFLTSAGIVVGMLTHGHPEFYFHLPADMQSSFPADKRFESLLRLDYVFENINSRDQNLANELF